MIYTKQQLKDALCARYDIEATEIPALIEKVQRKIHGRRSDLQRKLAALPDNAKEALKIEAIQYLADQSEAQTIADNKDIEL